MNNFSPRNPESGKRWFLVASAIACGAYLVFSFALQSVFADPPTSNFLPGETLNPGCAPTSSFCTVQPPLFSTTTLPVGGVLFDNDTSGTITANTSLLYLNTANGDFGVGTAAPYSDMQVAGMPVQSTTSTLVLLGNSYITGGNASGTFIGANPSSSYGGDFVNFEVNSSSQFEVSSSGVVTAHALTLLNSTSSVLYGNASGVVGALGIGSGLSLSGGSLSTVGAGNVSVNATSSIVADQFTAWSTSGSSTLLTTSTLYLSPANGYIGISTSSPSSPLSIAVLPGQTATSTVFLLGNNYITGGNASGTFIGANPSLGYNGDFVNFEVNSSSELRVSSSGNIFVNGLLNVTGTLNVANLTTLASTSIVGNLTELITTSSLMRQIATTSVGISPGSIYVSGRYAYVANNASNTISVVDISNPAAPVQIATTSVGNAPSSIYVSGRYAYVADSGNPGGISVVDVSNPHAPSQVAETSAGNVSPQSVYVSGRYAYVANLSSANLSVIDISNPLAPVQVASATVGTFPDSVYVSGRYAYVTNNASNTISVVDVSNPLAPIQVATTSVGTGPQSIYVSGRYAYVANFNASTISVVDVSNPLAPIQVATTSVPSNPQSLYASGRYIYVANHGTNSISVIDVSNPLVPVLAGTVAVGSTPFSIYVSGRYAYVANFGSNSISVVDISGEEVSGFIANSAEVGSLQVRNDIVGQGQLQITGGANIGAGGVYSSGGLSVLGSSSFVGALSLGTSSAPLSPLWIALLPAQNTTSTVLLLGPNYITGGNASGTLIGANPMPAAFQNGDFINFELNSSTEFKVNASGSLIIATGTAAANALLTIATATPIFNITAGGVVAVPNNAGGLAIGTSTLPAGVLFTVGTSTPILNVFASGLVEISSTKGLAIGTSTQYSATTTLTVCPRSNCTLPATASDTNAVAVFGSIAGTTTSTSIVAKGSIASGQTDVGEYIQDAGSDSSYVQGELLSVDPNASDTFEPSQIAYDPDLAGAITITAGLIAGGGDDNHGANVIVLAGRVPIEVTGENGPIAIGDYITSSEVAGYGMKATQPGEVVGIAMQAFSGTSVNTTGTILTFIDPHYELGNQSFLQQVTQYVQAALQNLGVVIVDGVATLKEIVVDKVTTNVLCVQNVCVTGDQLNTLLQNAGIIGGGGGSPPSPPAPTPVVAPAPTPTPAPNVVSSTDDTIPSASSSDVVAPPPTPSASSSASSSDVVAPTPTSSASSSDGASPPPPASSPASASSSDAVIPPVTPTASSTDGGS